MITKTDIIEICRDSKSASDAFAQVEGRVCDPKLIEWFAAAYSVHDYMTEEVHRKAFYSLWVDVKADDLKIYL